jgi:polyferredoxin
MNPNIRPIELELDDGPLYVAHQKVYPQSVHGTFRRIKWGLMAFCLGVYYLLPFVRWNRGLGAPSQAVLVDIPNSRFYFFFIELWPQEVYYFTGLLILAAITLFLMNSLGGRIWCGYLCPQTVWTDLFYAVERLVEGDRRERMKKDAARGTMRLQRVRRNHAEAFDLAVDRVVDRRRLGSLLQRCADAGEAACDLPGADAGLYLDRDIDGHDLSARRFHARTGLRLHVPVAAHPGGADRRMGAQRHLSPRPRRKTHLAEEGERLRALGEHVGDCIDCYQCVAVCPTGIDIRDGAQLGCIQCGLCIDACDTVMKKVGRETRLIGYDNDINIQRRQAGKPEIYRMVRPRTVVYCAMIAAVGAVMLYALLTRTLLDINVLHDRNPVAVKLSDGSIRNAYTVRLLNKRGFDRVVAIDIDGPPNATVHIVGADSVTPDRPMIVLGRDQTTE